MKVRVQLVEPEKKSYSYVYPLEEIVEVLQRRAIPFSRHMVAYVLQEFAVALHEMIHLREHSVETCHGQPKLRLVLSKF